MCCVRLESFCANVVRICVVRGVATTTHINIYGTIHSKLWDNYVLDPTLRLNSAIRMLKFISIFFIMEVKSAKDFLCKSNSSTLLALHHLYYYYYYFVAVVAAVTEQ